MKDEEARKAAHDLDATVRVGKGGVDSVADELADQLANDEPRRSSSCARDAAAGRRTQKTWHRNSQMRRARGWSRRAGIRLFTCARGDTKMPEQEQEPYAEDTVLTQVFGNHAEPKILAALLSEPDQDLNVTQIAELAGVSRKTVYEHLDRFVELGLVEQTREVAG